MVNKIVEAGTIKSRTDLQMVPYKMTMLDETHLPEMLNLNRMIVENLSEWDLLVPITAEMLRVDLGEKGLTLGTFVGERLIGFRSAHFPGNDEDNLGRDVGLPEFELEKVMHLEFALIHPDFRGNSLQKRMTARILKIVHDLKLHYRYCCSFVSPKNGPSLEDKFSLNLLIARLMLKFGNYWRFFFQDMLRPLRVQSNESISVPNRDIEQQVELLSQGYYGFRLDRRGSDCNILYAKWLDDENKPSGLRG